MARRRISPLLFVFVVAAVGLVTAGGLIAGGILPTGGRDVVSSLSIEVVAENGTVAETLAPQSPLAIILGGTTDITNYLEPDYISGGPTPLYFIRLTPEVRPAITGSASAMRVTVKWDPVIVNGQNYQYTYRGTRINNLETTSPPITPPVEATTTISGVKTGEWHKITDPNCQLALRLTNALPTPPAGQSYTITGKVTVTAVLLEGGAEQGAPITNTGTLSITVKNQPTGTLSALDVRVTWDIVSAF